MTLTFFDKEFKINYFSPLKLGDELVCEAVVLYEGRTHMILECVAAVGDRVIAKTLGTYNVYTPKKDAPKLPAHEKAKL